MSPLVARVATAIIYGLGMFILLIVLAIVIVLIPGGIEVAALLRKFAVVLAVLTGIVVFFSGTKTLFK